ncbi:hypothetical protein AB0G16_36965, partial [Streptosporangium sp. NPDC023615]
ASHVDHARAVLDSTPGPADTVVVEVPSSAGLYDDPAAATSPAHSVPPQPAASGSATASVASPARSGVPPQPSLSDVSTRPTVPASSMPRIDQDLPGEAGAPAVPVSGEHLTPAPQAASDRSAPAGPESAEPQVPVQGTSPDRPAASAAQDRPRS